MAPLDGGDPDVLALGVLAGSPEYEVYDGLVKRLPEVLRSRRALTVSLVQSSCRRYQPRGVVRALPWRVARRRSGSRMVVGVRGGVPRVRGGVGCVGCRGPARPRQRMVGPGWARPGYAVPGGFFGERWALGRFGGVLEACGWRWGACAGRRVG